MFNLGPQESNVAFSLILLLFLIFGWRQTDRRLTAIAALVAGCIGLFGISRIYEHVTIGMMPWFIGTYAAICMIAYALGGFVYKVYSSGRG